MNNEGYQASELGNLAVQDLPDLPQSIKRRLSLLGIVTVEDLVTGWSERRFLVFGYRIGKKSIRAINKSLKQIGVRPLGINAPRETVEYLC